jgi:hypothetical protein
VQVDAHGTLLITFNEPDPPFDDPVLDVLTNLVEFTGETVRQIETICRLPWFGLHV